MADNDPTTFRHGLNLTAAWTWRWTVAGAAIGFLLMVSRTAPFAESGGRSAYWSAYAAWIPVTSLLFFLTGLATGAAFAMVTATVARSDSLASLGSGQRAMLCGALAGAIVGLPTLFSPGMLPGFVALIIFTAITGWVMRHHAAAFDS